MTENAQELHLAAGPSGEFRPIPDPTKLTTDQLRRELGTLREILETRLTGMDRATDLVSAQANVLRAELEQIRTRLREEMAAEITQLRELLEARLDGMDRSTEIQFSERDLRVEQAAESAGLALAAALSGQKELVAQQNEANSTAAAKAEANFTKQIDQIGTIMQAQEKATDARITALKERLDRGEGSAAGAAGFRSDRAQVTGQALMTLSVLVAVIGLLILAFRH
jgi:hypothetical protein